MRAGSQCVLLIAAAGCNQVFDIGETRPARDVLDLDGDGVEDAEDNCIDVPNADQANADGDTFGDACDLCPATATENQHDEDHDEIGDACDVCPGVRDFGEDMDQDGVGDLCDRGGAVRSSRVLFDPFVTLRPGLTTGTVAWVASDDEIAPVDVLGPLDPGLRAPSVRLASDGWWVAVVTRSVQRWTAGEDFGLRLLNTSTGAMWASCNVDCLDDTSCFGGLSVAGSPGAGAPAQEPSPEPGVWYTFSTSYMAATNQTVVACQIKSHPTLKIIVTGRAPEVTPQFIATPNVHMTSVDIVQ